MGVIDEHVRDDMQPGDSGTAADARAVAKKANAIGDLVTTGRLSETELSATIEQVAIPAAQDAVSEFLASGALAPDADMVIVGGSEVAVSAAIRAARMGSSVIVLAEGERLGGVTGWALTQTDFTTDYSPGMVGWGVAREIFDRVAAKMSAVTPGAPTTEWARWYRTGGNARPSMWVSALEEMVLETPGIRVIRNAPLRHVSKSGTTVTSVTAGSLVITGRVFLEATPTGDLIRMAGLSTRIGREASATYGEAGSEIGVQAPSVLNGNVDPYVTPGVPGSGLLYGIDPGAAGTVNGSDPNHVMLSGIRTYVTSTGRAPWPAPTTYDATKYELIARIWAADAAYFNGATALEALGRTFVTYPLNDTSTEIDMNHGLYPTALPEPTLWREYVDATHERRQEITLLARDYFLGLIKFIRESGDSRVPANLKSAMNTYGPRVGEMVASGGVSPQVYLREGRRLIGAAVLTRVNAVTAQNTTNAQNYIGWMAYDYDAKPTRALVSGGVVATEGAVWVHNRGDVYGAPIPYWTICPQAGECVNILSPSAPSMSRFAWLAGRAVPVLLNLGDSAGAAAAIAVKRGIPVQDVSALEVRQSTGQFIPPGAIVLGTGYGSSGTLTPGSWTQVASADSRWPGPSAATFWEASPGEATKMRYAPNIFRAGRYRVSIFYPPGNITDLATIPVARPADTAVRIVHADGTTVRTVNQKYPGAGGGRWEDLGVFYFAYGTPSAHYVEFDASGVTAGKAVAGLVAWTSAD